MVRFYCSNNKRIQSCIRTLCLTVEIAEHSVGEKSCTLHTYLAGEDVDGDVARLVQHAELETLVEVHAHAAQLQVEVLRARHRAAVEAHHRLHAHALESRAALELGGRQLVVGGDMAGLREPQRVSRDQAVVLDELLHGAAHHGDHSVVASLSVMCR